MSKDRKHAIKVGMSEAGVALQNKLQVERRSLGYQTAYLRETFSDELWQAMEHRNLTQAEFAALAGVQRQFLTKVFRGGNCTFDTVAKLAFALNYCAHVHLTPNDIDCAWIHAIPFRAPRPAEEFYKLARGSFSPVSKKQEVLSCETVTSNT